MDTSSSESDEETIPNISKYITKFICKSCGEYMQHDKTHDCGNYFNFFIVSHFIIFNILLYS